MDLYTVFADHLLKTKKVCKNLRYIYQNELDEVCIQHDMANEDFHDLPRRTSSNKALYNIAKNSNMMDIKVDLHQRFINFVVKSLLVVCYTCK